MNLRLCWIEPAYDFSCFLDVGGSTDVVAWGIGDGADDEAEVSESSDVAFSVSDEAAHTGGGIMKLNGIDVYIQGNGFHA